MRKCVGCGDCCGHYLPLTAQEIAEIILYTQEHGIKPNYTGIDCPWLAKNRTCAIYKARPSICKAYHCVKHMRGTMEGKPTDYHVYNTERLFIMGDMTHYDALAGLMGNANSYGNMIEG